MALALAGVTIVFNAIAMGLDFSSGSTRTWVVIGGGLFGLQRTEPVPASAAV
ncbi:hypothetical protein [Pseudoclavibacter sp. JSM 162008]|uniref:hypothetical protein n=1 Tax=Pseudoclavibacter sp. JSM 162008 TaxID=3229855 RepID=UPI0035238652